MVMQNRLACKADRLMPEGGDIMTPYEIKYIEWKTGYSGNGPAWTGRVKKSKSGSTVYFNDKAFKKFKGIGANYV